MIRERRLFTGIWCLVIFGAGCASMNLQNAQKGIRVQFDQRDFAGAATAIQNLETQGVYREKDRVLSNLEKGVLWHLAGDNRNSLQALTAAEDEIDRLFTKSISDIITSFLLNDSQLAYAGEDYEDIYLNAFKSLIYLDQNKLDEALVEARRMSYKLERLQVKYEGQVAALAEQDTSGRGDWRTGKSGIQNSAFGHYLSTILFAKSGKSDDARIEFSHLQQALRDQRNLFGVRNASQNDLAAIRSSSGYNVLLVGFSGLGPIKIAKDYRLYDDETELYFKFSIPELHERRSLVSDVRVIVDGAQRERMFLIEDMQGVAREMFKVRAPLIYAKGAVRSVIKAIAAKLAKDKVEKEAGEGWGLAMQIAGMAFTEVSEVADTRGWQTMPGQVYSNVINLDVGDHVVTLEYLSSSGQVLFSEDHSVTINANDGGLNLVESFYAH